MTTSAVSATSLNASELDRVRTLDLDTETPIVVQGNAREHIRAIPAESVHAIVTDPPYGLDIGRQTGKKWDRADANPAFDVEFWEDAYAALKPGGVLIAFGASRTVHRLTVAIEDAGFTIEESILAWTRADKKLVDLNVAKEFAKRGEPEMAETYADCHSMFKPAYEPIVLARKPFADGMTRLDNIREHGVGFLNFADAYTPTSEDLSRTPGVPSKDGVMYYVRGGMERSTPHAGGRYPHNMVFLHTPDCDETNGCAYDCSAGIYEHEHKGKTRFFRSFFHTGRTPQSERITIDGETHLTVKPQSVMEWLVGMATLPGQIVLDPFAGSGSTAVAAQTLGRQSISFELGEPHAAIIRERISGARPVHG
ncbi:site-specific DNA-methyltransferase [Microbacterium sp. 77mftsu3.1]|uniref:DNA-methyltransferase n=1 Tax=Microbacterium sp. 77mftsu3.1 TaxID=1761802 RepID=UPI0015A2C322|nr:site-specific DNA-methyltransferase [Microbacterium sp. 77mftsu3.1]